MIKKLYPNLKDKPLFCEKYQLDVTLESEKQSMSLDMYLEHDDIIEILNGFENKKIISYINLSKYKTHYYVQYADFKIKSIKLRAYYDFYGRECTVNIDKIYDFKERTLVYSSINKKIFDDEYHDSVLCDFYLYSESEEFEDYIEFKVDGKEIDRSFFLYNYDKYTVNYRKDDIMTFRINKETLDLTCVEKPELLTDMKVKNI
jgi:hypothetical protein